MTISLHSGEFRDNSSSSIGGDADTALPAYIAVLALFAAVMTGTTVLAMKMKDRKNV